MIVGWAREGKVVRQLRVVLVVLLQKDNRLEKYGNRLIYAEDSGSRKILTCDWLLGVSAESR